MVNIGVVCDVKDPFHGNRVKVRLTQDGDTSISKLDWAFPLLPKYIQPPIKKDDCVLVITASSNNIKSQRYYIGPVISQPQFMEGEEFKNMVGSCLSLIQGGYESPKETIDHFSVTDGAFPDLNDVAILGRVSEDIILKDGEIDIRCGIRNNSNVEELNNAKVEFNSVNPTYIQLKRLNNKGFVNIVGDGVNIMSHEGVLKCGTKKIELSNQPELMSDEWFDACKDNLHQVPYGDVLIKILKMMTNAFKMHTHSWADMPPDGVAVLSIDEAEVKMNEVLSDTLRIT